MKQLDIFDAIESAKARDAGMERVAYNADDFMPLGLLMISKLAPWTYTGEAIREQLTAAGIVPHHHNAWGALICAAVRQHLLFPTGRYEAMTAIRSHARKTQVYERRRPD